MRLKYFLKVWILALFVIPVACHSQVNKGKTGDRQPVVAGTYYPPDPVQLKAQLADFFRIAGEGKIQKNIAAIIVPHAGYIFSGQVAADAYSRLDPDKNYSRIFIIGTSHHVLLNGASVYNQGNFLTPLGAVEVDSAVGNELIRKNKLFEPILEAHDREHSLEVQLPFLQYRLINKFKIVPIVIGTQSENTCKKLAETLKPYFTEENLFVISSDFSHYPAYANALLADKNTGDAIAANSPSKFVDAIRKNLSLNIPNLTTSCCGWSSVLTLLDITSELKNINTEHVGYANSGDTRYGDKEKVVGYHSFVFLRNKPGKQENFSLTFKAKKQLLTIARQTIDSYLSQKTIPAIFDSQVEKSLLSPCGAFVTLNKKGKLRGCIGRFMATEPLYKVVQQMAVAAAFQDSRFVAVSDFEMKEIEVEISVLTPLKKITDIKEFELGKHGIYMIKGNRSGTFLPQVAEETGWTTEEFLGHCARDKAGIGWDGWKDAELYTYEAIVFDESEFLPEHE